MKILIISDSQYGNTKQVAEAMLTSLAEGNEVRSIQAKDAKVPDLTGVGLLIVGSPTQGGRPTQAIQDFLNEIPDLGLKGVRVAAFDTRIDVSKLNFVLRLLLKPVGFAAPKISSFLNKKGAISAPPEGFIVEGKEGPLRNGELERAKAWVTKLI